MLLSDSLSDKQIESKNGETPFAPLSPSNLAALLKRLASNIETVIVGKHELIESCLIGLMAGGHILLEDVPGVGKTMLARSIARTLGTGYKRIQFTPDLLPSDVTGTVIFDPNERLFSFREGPIFSHVVLADEINRASPKTQSALLECMEEHQVTVDLKTRHLPEPFFVIATQNPVESEGVYPLPDSQLDRFAMRLSVGYPHPDAEKLLMKEQRIQHPIETLQSVTNVSEVARGPSRHARRGYSRADLRLHLALGQRHAPTSAFDAGTFATRRPDSGALRPGARRVA